MWKIPVNRREFVWWILYQIVKHHPRCVELVWLAAPNVWPTHRPSWQIWRMDVNERHDHHAHRSPNVNSLGVSSGGVSNHGHQVSNRLANSIFHAILLLLSSCDSQLWMEAAHTHKWLIIKLTQLIMIIIYWDSSKFVLPIRLAYRTWEHPTTTNRLLCHAHFVSIFPVPCVHANEMIQ